MYLFIAALLNSIMAIVGLYLATGGRNWRMLTGESHWLEKLGVTLLLASGCIAIYLSRL